MILFALHLFNEFVESPTYWWCQTLPLQSHLLENSLCSTPGRGRTIIRSWLGQDWTTVQIWTNQITSSEIFGTNILRNWDTKLLEIKLKAQNRGYHLREAIKGWYGWRDEQRKPVHSEMWIKWLTERSRDGSPYSLWEGAWSRLCNPADSPDPNSRPRRTAMRCIKPLWLELARASFCPCDYSILSMAFDLYHVSSHSLHHFQPSVYTNLPRRLLRTRARKQEIKIYWVPTMRM